MIPVSDCVYCKNLTSAGKNPVWRCTAFPTGDGIPQELIFGDKQHREPIEGDHGIMFEPAEGFENMLKRP